MDLPWRIPPNVTINLIPSRSVRVRSSTKGKTLIPITCVSPRFCFGSRAPFSNLACYTFWYTQVNYSVEIILSKQREFLFPSLRFIVALSWPFIFERKTGARFFVAFFFGQNYRIFRIAEIYFCLTLYDDMLSGFEVEKVVKNWSRLGYKKLSGWSEIERGVQIQGIH